MQNLKAHFENALDEILHHSGNCDDDLLTFAQFILAETPSLAVDICNKVSNTTSLFKTEAAFLGTWQKTSTIPAPPEIDDPVFDPPNIRYDSPLERKVARVYRYKKAIKLHEKEVEESTRLRTQILAIRDHFSQSRDGYLDYVRAALCIYSGQSDQLPFPARVAGSLLAAEMDETQDQEKPMVSPDFADHFFFNSKALYISEKQRRKHTFICGGTGSGKTQTILGIIRHYLTKNTRPTLVVFDPHDPLAQCVAKSRELVDNERLVYIDLAPKEPVSTAFNPFDIPDRYKTEKGLNPFQKHLAAGIGQLFEQGLTPQMKSFLVPCVGLMLHRQNSTLLDLFNLMSEGENGKLLNYGRQHLPNEVDRQFFIHDFMDKKSFGDTKLAVKRRLFGLVRDPIIRDFLCRNNTFDLDEALEGGKVIVFNFRKGKTDKDVIRTIGQLLTGYISGYAVRRHAEDQPKPRPIHLFQDECQYFASPEIREILTETRKYQLHATLATQTLEQMNSGDRKVIDLILANCGVFHVGGVGGGTATKLSSLMRLKKDELENLPNLVFQIWERGKHTVKTKIPFIGHEFDMKPEQWREVLKTQHKNYYEPICSKSENRSRSTASIRPDNKPAGFSPKLQSLDVFGQTKANQKPTSPETKS